MAAKKNTKATTTTPKEKKKPDKNVTAKKSTKAGTKGTKGRLSAGGKTGTKKEAATPVKTKKEMLSIKFELKAPHAQKVFISGDFNGWVVDKDKMNKGKDGIWRKNIRLPHGRYEYQFLVDGHWWTDPENPNRTWNAFGTQNSVMEI